MEIVVVTKIPTGEEESGNLALAGLDMFWATGEQDDNYLDKVKPLKDALTEMLGSEQQALGFILNLRQRVFEVGEILILNSYGREIGYPGRKPSKWFVETETVSSLEEAHELAQALMRT